MSRRSGDTPVGETIKANPRNEKHSKNSKAEHLEGMGSEEEAAPMPLSYWLPCFFAVSRHSIRPLGGNGTWSLKGRTVDG